ncbi:Tubulin epsilon chain [Tetrabaena socialis]|uniref:Tubulin epsilon chain n=1 Tax=Tetrabaena socialis TaxID=47790 RepID=A0A2J8A100_9CHLO|nr:Tubulin epsilon chain [Tetrabaena socialis]|eukprot:PNH06175.1 Tubulin epsilon chain [Tetrabaena socialis]
MPRELVTIQVGQCGNQVGCRFWELALREHAAYNTKGVYDEALSSFFRNVDTRVEPFRWGILWGPGHWPLVCLLAQWRAGKTINVFPLVDTGTPVTELSQRVFSALGCEDIHAATTISSLGGYSPTQVRLRDQGEHSNHRHIPILGADFLAKNRRVLEVDDGQETVLSAFRDLGCLAALVALGEG